MEFEGTHNVIGIRGIERSAADLVVKDGGLEEAVGLIPRDGSLIPYAPKIVSNTSYDKQKFVRVHHTQNEDHTIEVYDDHYVVYGPWTTTGGVETRRTIKPEDPSDTSVNVVVKDIVFVGNRMDLQTATGIEHWLWKNGKYENVGDADGDLYSTANNQTEFALPRAEFKVRRGIYDGSNVYRSAKFFRVNDNYTGARTDRIGEAEFKEIWKEALSKKFLLGDGLATLDSVRAIGGITGYILVAAAWRRKGSTPTNPQYIMASPVMLMGAPEIYMKEGKYEDPEHPYHFIDEDYYKDGDNDRNYLLTSYPNKLIEYEGRGVEVFDELWNKQQTDDREAEDLAENENVDIEKEDDDSVKCQLATSRLEWTLWPMLTSPAFWQERYAMYYHNGSWIYSDQNSMYRSVTITHASANVLSVRVDKTLEDKYKDEVDRLCVFISPIISPYKGTGEGSITMEGTYHSQSTELPGGEPWLFCSTLDGTKPDKVGYAHSFIPEMKGNDEIIDAARNIAGLYKVKEYQLSEIPSEGWVDINLSGKLESDKLIQHTDTMLKISDLQPVSIVEGNLFGYNERLHVYNFQKSEVYKLPYASMKYHKDLGQYNDEEEFNEPYEGGEAISPSGTNPANYQYIVTIVDSNDSTLVYLFRGKFPSLNQLAMHGDIEVKSIKITKRFTKILATQQETTTKYYAGTVDYPIVEIAGLCGGYVSPDLKPFNIKCTEVTEVEYNKLLPEENISADGMSYGKNEIRVSDVGTTLFDVKSSYKIGHGEILGMARLAMSLSQDNYGKYPLVIFCTDGIYTMDVDASGQTAYKIQSPLGREICSNVNGICEIDGAVVFPTEQGLFIVTQEGVKPVGLSVRGAAKGYPAEDATNFATTAFREATNNAKLVQLKDAFSGEDFLKYINNTSCYIRYLQQLSVIVCYRGDKNYAYIISIGDWSVWKLNTKIITDDKDYPKASFYLQSTTNATKDIPHTFDFESNESNIPCLLETRPIKLETVHAKAAYRVVLRGVFNNSVTESAGDEEENKKFYAGIYVFGSYGGKNWFLLGGKEKLLKRFNDLGVETHRTSARFLKVVFVGKLSKDSHIDGLEITNEVRYNNKLK